MKEIISEYDPRTGEYQRIVRDYLIPDHKHIVGYWKSGDPSHNCGYIESCLEEINIIRTRNLSDEFNQMLVRNKHRVFLHLLISGLNNTIVEPNIPPVRHIFNKLIDLINAGFPQKQILVIVDPVIQNDNGLKTLELILRAFTEYKNIRLRFIRFCLLRYKDENGKTIIANPLIMNRTGIIKVLPFIRKTPDFYSRYKAMLARYQSIICVDDGMEATIGIRELSALGYKNEWFDKKHNTGGPIITYKNNHRWEPDVKIISGRTFRCSNKCLLCPYYG